MVRTWGGERGGGGGGHSGAGSQAAVESLYVSSGRLAVLLLALRRPLCLVPATHFLFLFLKRTLPLPHHSDRLMASSPALVLPSNESSQLLRFVPSRRLPLSVIRDHLSTAPGHLPSLSQYQSPVASSLPHSPCQIASVARCTYHHHLPISNYHQTLLLLNSYRLRITAPIIVPHCPLPALACVWFVHRCFAQSRSFVRPVCNCDFATRSPWPHRYFTCPLLPMPSPPISASRPRSPAIHSIAFPILPHCLTYSLASIINRAAHFSSPLHSQSPTLAIQTSPPSPSIRGNIV